MSEPRTEAGRPTPHRLWQQANGDRDEYQRLLVEHGHLIPNLHRTLPDRVVVGANGAYWRDFGTHYSMCVVSTDNDPVEPVAVYVREAIEALAATPAPTGGALDASDVALRLWQFTYHAFRDEGVSEGNAMARADLLRIEYARLTAQEATR